MHVASISEGLPEQVGAGWRGITGEVGDFLDSIQWESAWPGLLIAGLLFFAICSVAFSKASSDEEEAEYWRRLALAGRGLFSLAAVAVAIGWMGGRMTGLI